MFRSVISLVVRVCALMTAACLFLHACGLPGATELNGQGEPCFMAGQLDGSGLLLTGWVTVFAPPMFNLFLSWLANPVCLTAAVFLGIGRSSVAFVVSAVGLALAPLALLSYRGLGFHEAFNWWLGSFAVLTVGCAIAALIDRRDRRETAVLFAEAVRRWADPPVVLASGPRSASEGIEPATRLRIEAEPSPRRS